ncbi:MAG: hypothetical protein ACTHN5_17405, partial [Phycisphaerae bacterium]
MATGKMAKVGAGLAIFYWISRNWRFWVKNADGQEKVDKACAGLSIFFGPYVVWGGVPGCE